MFHQLNHMLSVRQPKNMLQQLNHTLFLPVRRSLSWCKVQKPKSRMNPSVKENIITEIFKKVSKNNYLCKECFNFEIYCGVSNKEDMLIHVFHSHRHFWNVAMHHPSSLSQHVWAKLYNFYAQPSIIKCKHCTMVVDINIGAAVLHRHTRTYHGILLLAFSL